MPDEQPKSPRRPRLHPQTVIPWLLFLGLVVSFGANIRAEHEIGDLTMDLQTLREESQRQLAALREAQTTSSGQDLARLDQLTTQLQRANEEDRQKIAESTTKMRSDLTKTVEQRHQEVVHAIADVRADVKSAATAKPSPFTENQKPHSEGPQAISQQVNPWTSRTVEPVAPPASSAAQEEKAVEPLSSSAAAPKKHFWSKLNPFGHKKHQQNGEGLTESSNAAANTSPAQ